MLIKLGAVRVENSGEECGTIGGTGVKGRRRGWRAGKENQNTTQLGIKMLTLMEY